MNPKSKKYFITGCSTGIGEACALSLAKQGHQTFAGVRKMEDGERLKSKGGENLLPVIIEVTSSSSITKALGFISEKLDSGQGLDGLINNAGIVVAGPLEFLKTEALRNQLETNVISVLAVTQAFLPLIRRGRGRIVNIGSISGLIATPFTGPYAASKFAVRALTDSLRLELSPWNIPVSLIEPGPIATAIWDKSIKAAHDLHKDSNPGFEKYYKEIMEKFEVTVKHTAHNAVPVEWVVKVVEQALFSAKPKAYYPVGRAAKLQSAISHLLPQSLLDKVLAKSTGLSQATPPQD